ncbi:putative ribonuclease H [Erwinia phage vB_EamM_Phobos]|uniref:ribonuclease n=1 Tax=Erwinia phage vB_EamM_Phobos TaxID=1883377 RepID=UPI00081D18CC|nr:ribonuclease [Erwinia phage vB_EamM_Phobos]ANZ50390.1 putative ribonuclease H [Erwinia phage vB_EamM_Phobos]
MEQVEVAVLYSDGSHFPDPHGSGAGIFAYTIDKLDEGFLGGYSFPGVPDAITSEGFKPMTLSDPKPMLPVGRVKFWESVIPVRPSSAQVGELTAFIAVFDKTPFKAKKYIIYADSTYMINTVTDWIWGWERNGWRRADGTPCANLDILKRILAILKSIKEEGITLIVRKIKAHAGHYGNEMADKLAKQGAAASALTNEHNFQPFWREVFNDEETPEESMFIEPEKPGAGMDITSLPSIMSHKWHYMLGDEPTPSLTLANGEKWEYVMSGHHAKDKNDLVLVGKFLPDAMFSVTLHRKAPENLKFVADEHAKQAWEGVPAMKQYSAITMVNGDHLRRKKFVEAAKNGLPLSEMEFKSDGNAWMFGDTCISYMLRPALLSYRVLEIRDELATMLKDVVDGHHSVTFNDITLKFFDEEGKPRKDYYRNVDRSIKLPVNFPGSDKQIDVILSRGIDMPGRTELNRIMEPGGKFGIATWRRDKQLVQYALVYLGAQSHGLWMGYYSAKRILTAEQI